MEKQTKLMLFILFILLLSGSGVAGVANADPISSSFPTIHELQSVSSTPAPSDSIDEGSAQGSVMWSQSWNLRDGNWFYVDSVNPVSLHSGWLYA
ncbi:hypothetical protein ACQRAQ_08615, partial [Collinsella sp. SGI.178]|uniref:hypothetical protein n=1 Tax=Collinsella sp. SGI.178 TaxID=3420554 RepID=UPI003CFBC3CC